MKRYLLILLICAATMSLQAQFTQTTITQIQTVSADSLKLADSLGVGSTRWTTQTSPKMGTKVEVTALVVVEPRYITYTAGGRTLVLTDTGANAGKPFSYIMVRYSTTSSVISLREKSFDVNGYNSVKRGDIIQIRGTISEFPTTSGQAMNSFTQFDPDTNEAVVILSSNNPVPGPTKLPISTFNTGNNPGGKVMFSTGEQYESAPVMFTNLTVTAAVNVTRGTWQVVDTAGNYFSMYDWSKYFTLGHGGSEAVAGDASYKVPPVGAKIDTLYGFIATSSGTESTRGYRICPLFLGDVKYGKIAPAALNHRRFPVIVAKDTLPRISAKVFRQSSGAPILAAKVVYSVNNGPWLEVTMPAPGATDSVATVAIPAQPVGSLVKYFIKVTDTGNNETILSNSATLVQYDSSKGFFAYKVIDRAAQPVLSIQDVQTTPFVNGRSLYIGAVDSVAGIVTADTASLLKVALSSGGTNVYYIQSTSAPWSGLWVTGPDSILQAIANGDSVVVTGTVGEFNEITRLQNVTKVRVVSKAKPLPAPLVFKTERFGAGAANGNANAEPYEGMLVRFDSVTVTSIEPVYQDFYQFEVSNSAQGIIVARDGKNSYTSDTASATPGIKLKVGTKIKSLTGILYFGGNRYKVVPRTNADYGTVTGVKVMQTEIVPVQYSLEQNYPNPFNPSTTIQYGLPVSGLVTLKVYNVIGQEVATLVNQQQGAGIYTVSFDASKFASGMYLYRISSGNFVQIKKMMLVK